MEKGIVKLKEALGVCIEVGTKIDKALADDGNIDIIEGFGIGIKAVKFIRVVKNIKEIKAEFLDLDDSEKAELKEFVNTELDISNDEAEEWIERVFSTLMDMYGIFF